MRSLRAPLWAVVTTATAALAQDVGPITKLEPFSLLVCNATAEREWRSNAMNKDADRGEQGACAATALNAAVTSQTYLASCGSSPSQLQSCVCSDDSLSRKVLSSIARGVQSRCQVYSTDDIASAQAVFTAYCDDGYTPDFPTPTTNIVPVYITGVPGIEWLAPCAASGIEEAMMKEVGGPL